MTDTIRKKDTIATPYDPEQVVGEWGWLWLPETEEEGDGWVLCRTIEDDLDDILRTEAFHPMDPRDEHTVYAAEALKGTPYIPLHMPKCGPQAGAMVAVWLHGGGCLTVTHEDHGDHGARADRPHPRHPAR